MLLYKDYLFLNYFLKNFLKDLLENLWLKNSLNAGGDSGCTFCNGIQKDIQMICYSQGEYKEIIPKFTFSCIQYKGIIPIQFTRELQRGSCTFHNSVLRKCNGEYMILQFISKEE